MRLDEAMNIGMAAKAAVEVNHTDAPDEMVRYCKMAAGILPQLHRLWDVLHEAQTSGLVQVDWKRGPICGRKVESILKSAKRELKDLAKVKKV